MAKKTAQDLPPRLELLCLKALWTLGEGNVNEVRDLVSATKPLAYTTVMTLLERLARKGVAARRKVGRAFVYAPQVSQESVRRTAFREFLEQHFDGSTDRLLDFLRDTPEADTERAVTAGFASNAQLDTALL